MHMITTIGKEATMKIKGHTEIQIRDAKTGRMVQNTHDDNMVTNGLAGFFKNHGMLNTTPFISDINSDLITTLLGGILLFNDTLPASADTVMTPDGIKMTANGAYGVTYTGDPTELGSYDANESGWQDAAHTTFRFVYNWTESQGNGVIKSAALTSRAHGFVGEGNSTSEKKTTSADNNNTTFANFTNQGNRYNEYSEVIFAIKNNVAYSLKVNTSSQTLTIRKSSVSDTVCDIRDKTSFRNMNFVDVAELTNPSSDNLVTFDGTSVRFLSNKVVIALRSSAGVLVFTLNSSMDTIDDYDDITASATGLTWDSRDTFFLTADAEYLIVYNDSSSKLYKIEIANPVNVTEVTIQGTLTTGGNYREYLSVGKRHYISNYIYDETQNKAIITNDNGTMQDILSGDIYKDDSSMIITMASYNTYNSDVGRNNKYLATVNNLQNAVTKDSTQTMKVIYTLTFSS